MRAVVYCLHYDYKHLVQHMRNKCLVMWYWNGGLCVYGGGLHTPIPIPSGAESPAWAWEIVCAARLILKPRKWSVCFREAFQQLEVFLVLSELVMVRSNRYTVVQSTHSPALFPILLVLHPVCSPWLSHTLCSCFEYLHIYPIFLGYSNIVHVSWLHKWFLW